MERDSKKKSSLSASFKVGAIALAFMVIGYQVALFVRQAAVSKIAADRSAPDTVFVVDKDLAREVLREAGRLQEEGEDFQGKGGRKAPVPAPEAARLRPAPATLSDSAVTLRRAAALPPQTEAVANAVRRRSFESFPFNPNTVSVEDLQRLGFSGKQAAAIDNYRQKGGRFRRKSDFQRSFVVADSVFRRLESYICIPKVDINAADSAAFDDLPGIGPYFASKMVSYRRELGGGYSYKEQLMDIWHFDGEKFAALEDLIEVGPGSAYPLWSLPEDSLKLHPYIRSSATARGIVLFRENTPRSAWSVEALAAAGILLPDDAAKLSRCRIE